MSNLIYQLRAGVVLIPHESWAAVQTGPLPGLDVRDGLSQYPALDPVEAKQRLVEEYGAMDLAGRELVVLEPPRAITSHTEDWLSPGRPTYSVSVGVLRDDGTWRTGDLQIAFSDAYVRYPPTVKLDEATGRPVMLKRDLSFTT